MKVKPQKMIVTFSNLKTAAEHNDTKAICSPFIFMQVWPHQVSPAIKTSNKISQQIFTLLWGWAKLSNTVIQ